MADSDNCRMVERTSVCLAKARLPVPSGRLITAARKAGLPDTARSLRHIRREFDKFGLNPCIFCVLNGEEPLIAARRAIGDAMLHLERETNELEALSENGGLIRIRPGKKPEEAGFSIFKVLRSELHLSRSRYVDVSALAEELDDVRQMATDALKELETALTPAAVLPPDDC